jgi:hypothetical protein
MNINRENAPQPMSKSALWVLGFFAVLFAAFFFRAAPLALDPVRTTQVANQFDTARALDRLSRVLDGTPHPTDSDALDQTRSRLLREIASIGYQPQVIAQNACRGSISGSSIRCAFVQNVFFKAGAGDGPALVLTAHYDSVDASPGFGDDGIGVAVWLEVAHHLKQNPPNRPVLFLLTDGEETALLGAQAFVDSKEKYGVEVGRIINLEARGVRGPAMMFETGHPNAGIVGDWSKSGARPVANSMMTAVYELLPNSTDLTVHLHDGSTGINIAIADALDFYHTNHDDLARLDRSSVQHMGDQALGATRAFLAGDWSGDKTGGEIAYSDIGARLFVALPEMFALILLGLCFGVSAMMLVRPSRNSGWMKLDWRALALPPALIAVSGLFAFLTQQAIGLFREPSYWTAYPQALNMTFFAGTALVSAAALAFLAPNAKRETLFASGWFWFLIVGMGLSFAVPGFSILYLIPGIVFVLASGAAWLFPRYQIPAYVIASIVLVLIFFPILHMLDVMMGLGMAAAFGVVEAMVLAPMLAIIGGLRNNKALVFSALGIAFVASLGATAIVPAYSADRPLALNFSAQYDMDERRAAVYAGARPGALPKSILDQLTVGEVPPPVGSTNVLAARTMDFAPRPHAIATLISDTAGADGKRIIRLQLSAEGARTIRLRIPASAHPTQLTYDGRAIAMREPQQGYYVVEIIGRAANGATLEFALQRPANAPAASATKPDWLVQGIWTSLPPEAQALADSRPDNAVRIQMGDTTITTKKQQF